MEKAIIAALGKDERGCYSVIGLNGDLPWSIGDLPDDMKRFRALTIGQTVVMGRRTYESLKVRPLPKRQNIVLSRQSDFRPTGCWIVSALAEALLLANTPKIFFVGGASVYREALKLADRLYLTYVNRQFCGDRFFPAIDWEDWQERRAETTIARQGNLCELQFITYERKVKANEAISRAA